DDVRRAERDPAAADGLRRAVRRGRRRADLHRVRLLVPGRRIDAAAGSARLRLPAHAGAAARVRGLRARREPDHGPSLRRPRSAGAERVVAAAVALPDVPRRRLAVPGWARLLLTNPKSLFGLVVLAALVPPALAAPVSASH